MRLAAAAGSLLTLVLAAPAVVRAATPQLQVDAGRVVVGHRQAQLRLGCLSRSAGGSCHGRLLLLAPASATTRSTARSATAKTITVGATEFTVPAGTTRTVALRLTAAARRILATTPAHRLQIVTHVSSDGGTVTSRSVPLQLINQAGSTATTLLAVTA